MLRAVAGSLLLALALCNLQSADYEFGSNQREEDVLQQTVKILTDQGFSDDEVKNIVNQGNQDQSWDEDETYYSWEESKGYEECEEFIPERYRNKGRSKQGGFENEAENEIPSDVEDNQYGWDEEEDKVDRKKKHHRHHGGGGPGPRPRPGPHHGPGPRPRPHHGPGPRPRPHHGPGPRPRPHHGPGPRPRPHHGSGPRPGPHRGPGPQHGPGPRPGHGKCPKPVPLHVICAKYECPPADRMNSTGCGYSTRLVYGAKWVATNLDNITDIGGSTKRAFWRLFKYIQGDNDKNQKIDMTVPVMYKWFMDENYALTGGRMHFYLPSAHQDSPPVPTDTSVQIDELADAITYDRAFGGHNITRYESEFVKLGKALGDAGIVPYLGFSITLEYTRPGPGKQRHEVMLLDGGS